MGRWTTYFLFLLWLAYLLICGVLIFTRGFLLTRQVLPNNATCQDECARYKNEEHNLPQECIDRNQLRLLSSSTLRFACKNTDTRVILLVVDALRHDFAVFNHSIPDEKALPFQNRMPIFNELLETLPNNSRMFKFIANPPTTTLQRLKGITTGSLPTFIDAGSNFGGYEIEEDNIINQIVQQGKKVVTMGDDVWVSLFPGRSIREYPYPSFNIYDLDTVDNGVSKNLKEELEKKDWDLLVAHMLGVDHCGHAFGPNHPEMTRKLRQTNDVIRSIVDSMDDNTMLFVLGDHGMTGTGDHGGDSEQEVSAALFAYSTVPFVPHDIGDHLSAIYQVDLVPTLSFIMGTPIPFSNLGKMILELLQVPQVSGLPTAMTISMATEALATNIEQIMMYINTYTRQNHLFSKEKISSIARRFHDLRDDLDHVHDTRSFAVFRVRSLLFLTYVRNSFEEVWVQFDSFLMSRGIVLTFLLLAFTFILVEGVPPDNFAPVLERGLLFWAFVVVVSCALGSFSLEYLRVVDDGFLLSCVSTLVMAIFLMAATVVQQWKTISLLQQFRLLVSSIEHFFILLFSLLTFFSNSFVVEESQVLLFLTVTAAGLTTTSVLCPVEPPVVPGKPRRDEKMTLKKFFSLSRFKVYCFIFVFAGCLRLSVLFWRCREEQSWCQDWSRKIGRGSGITIITLATVAFFITTIRMWLRACGNLVGFSLNVAWARYSPSVAVVCAGGYWVLQGVPRESTRLMPWQQQVLPWTLFAIAAIGIVTTVLNPLNVYVMARKSDFLSVYGQQNVIPQLFHQVKEVMKNRKAEPPLVFGLGTSYSSTVILIAEYACLVFVLVLGDYLACSVVLLFASIVFLLLTFAYIRLENILDINQLFYVPWSYIICWNLLASYFFFGSGHQPTIPNIHWHAAFVGTGGQFTNNIIPGLLIGLNTFVSHILMGLMLPLLLIAPFTLYAMLPKWLPLTVDSKKQLVWSQLKQGELHLFEKEGLMQYSAFKLVIKYIMLNTCRVLASMLAAAIHCRHLMVWKIFAPRFIFEGLSFFVMLPATLVSFLLLARISHTVDSVISGLLKNS